MAHKVKGRDLYQVKKTIRGKRQSFYGKTPEEAEEAARLATDREKFLNLPLSKTPTFREFSQKRYLPTVIHHSASWKNQIGWALDKHIYPKFRSVPLEHIDRHSILTFFTSKIRQGYSRDSILTLRKVMFAVLNLAEIDGHISKNPVRFVKLPPIRTKEKPQPLTLEQVATLLGQCTNPNIYNAVYLAVSLGLRKRECLGLRFSDVENGQVRVMRQAPDSDGSTSLKTRSSQRVIPVGETWQRGISGDSEGLFCGGMTERNVFGSITGKRGYKWCLRKAGLPDRTFHSLRDTFATELASMGMPEELLAVVLGHSRKSVTAIYARPPMNLIGEWMERYHSRLSLLLETVLQSPTEGIV